MLKAWTSCCVTPPPQVLVSACLPMLRKPAFRKVLRQRQRLKISISDSGEPVRRNARQATRWNALARWADYGKPNKRSGLACMGRSDDELQGTGPLQASA